MAKKASVPRGHIPMLVGRGNNPEKIVIHINVLHHPNFIVLLEMAALQFGYDQKGILRIPCDVEHFRSIVDVIRRTNKIRDWLFFSPLTPGLRHFSRVTILKRDGESKRDVCRSALESFMSSLFRPRFFVHESYEIVDVVD